MPRAGRICYSSLSARVTARHCGRPLRAVVRGRECKPGAAPIEPEGVHPLAVAVQAAEDALSVAGQLECASHALPPHIQHCAASCVGFCSATAVPCTLSRREARPPPSDRSSHTLQTGHPEIVPWLYCKVVFYMVWIAPLGSGTGLGTGGAWCAAVRSRKLESRALPNAVAMLSGWNCTP